MRPTPKYSRAFPVFDDEIQENRRVPAVRSGQSIDRAVQTVISLVGDDDVDNPRPSTSSQNELLRNPTLDPSAYDPADEPFDFMDEPETIPQAHFEPQPRTGQNRLKPKSRAQLILEKVRAHDAQFKSTSMPPVEREQTRPFSPQPGPSGIRTRQRTPIPCEDSESNDSGLEEAGSGLYVTLPSGPSSAFAPTAPSEPDAPIMPMTPFALAAPSAPVDIPQMSGAGRFVRGNRPSRRTMHEQEDDPTIGDFRRVQTAVVGVATEYYRANPDSNTVVRITLDSRYQSLEFEAFRRSRAPPLPMLELPGPQRQRVRPRRAQPPKPRPPRLEELVVMFDSDDEDLE